MNVVMRNESGFSLIEVMISIVLLSIGLIGVAAMQVTAIRVNTIASKVTRSSTILQDQVEILMALPFDHADLNDTTDPGLCELHTDPTPPPGYAVSWCVDADVSGTKKTIDLVASWVDSGQDKNFTLSFIRSIFHH